MTSQTWRISDNQFKLVLTNEKHWKSTAIYYLYAQKNTEENFLWLSPDISDEHIAEIRDVHPDNTSKWGSEPANWVRKTGKDHIFDVLKYAYFAKDYALTTFRRERYRFGRAPSILRRFEKQMKHEAQKQQDDVKEKGLSDSLDR